jgi:hypothetical protein
VACRTLLYDVTSLYGHSLIRLCAAVALVRVVVHALVKCNFNTSSEFHQDAEIAFPARSSWFLELSRSTVLSNLAGNWYVRTDRTVEAYRAIINCKSRV